jgi:hypothetical protein
MGRWAFKHLRPAERHGTLDHITTSIAPPGKAPGSSLQLLDIPLHAAATRAPGGRRGVERLGAGLCCLHAQIAEEARTEGIEDNCQDDDCTDNDDPVVVVHANELKAGAQHLQ